MENERIPINIVNEGEEELVSITMLLRFLARRLGVVLWMWATVMLMQGVIVSALETKDLAFVTVMLFFVCFRYWEYICPQGTGLTLRAASRVSFISSLFYWCNLVSAMTSIVLSTMQLFTQAFCQTEVANKIIRDFGLNVFYSVALIEALLVLCALVLEVYEDKLIRMLRGETDAVQMHIGADMFLDIGANFAYNPYSQIRLDYVLQTVEVDYNPYWQIMLNYVLPKLVKTRWISTFVLICALIVVQYAFAFLSA